MSLKNFSDEEIERLYTSSIDGFKRGNYGNTGNLSGEIDNFEDYAEDYGTSKALKARGEIDYNYYNDGSVDASDGWRGVSNALEIKDVNSPNDLNQMLGAVRNEYFDRRSGGSKNSESEADTKKDEDVNDFYKPQEGIKKPTFLYEDSSEERISPYSKEDTKTTDSRKSPYNEQVENFAKARNRGKTFLKNDN